MVLRSVCGCGGDQCVVLIVEIWWLCCRRGFDGSSRFECCVCVAVCCCSCLVVFLKWVLVGGVVVAAIVDVVCVFF